MSFTGQDIVDQALALANMESGNVATTRQMALLNGTLLRYYRDMGGVDGVDDLSAASTPALTAGTQEYTLPAGVAQVDEWRMVGYRRNAQSTWMPLSQVDHTAADTYPNESGTPWAYYVYHPAGIETFGLIPTPDATSALGTVRRRYRYKPAELTAMSDTIALPPEAKGALAFMLAGEFALVDNNPNLAAFLRARAQEERARNSETLLDQTLAETNLAPQVMRTQAAGYAPTDRRFWGL